MGEKIGLTAVVPDSLSGERLDQVAAELFSEYSRSRLASWIKSGDLTANGEKRRPRDKVAPGDSLSIEAELEVQTNWVAQHIALDIIYEDDSIIVLDKPAGLVVHPAAGHADGTLVNALLAHCPDMDKLPRGGIVHRLDKETSGIMVAAKTLTAHTSLVEQLQQRTVKREYCAVCIGAMTGGGRIDEPMGRHPRQRKKMAVAPVGGKSAVTNYRVTRRFGHHTQVAVSLETGRTHQIRVHMSHRHYPLVGDPVYGGRPRLPPGASDLLIETLRGFSRQALHARVLGLLHPETGEPCEFECPLPDDIQHLLQVLTSEDPQQRDDALY